MKVSLSDKVSIKLLEFSPTFRSCW